MSDIEFQIFVWKLLESLIKYATRYDRGEDLTVTLLIKLPGFWLGKLSILLENAKFKSLAYSKNNLQTGSRLDTDIILSRIT